MVNMQIDQKQYRWIAVKHLHTCPQTEVKQITIQTSLTPVFIWIKSLNHGMMKLIVSVPNHWVLNRYKAILLLAQYSFIPWKTSQTLEATLTTRLYNMY